MKQGDPLDRWKSGGPLGTVNGSCDIKNGGGNFGPNAYSYGKSKRGQKSKSKRIFRFMVALFIVLGVLAALIMMLAKHAFQ
jgi:hypothetical protein